jgi:ribosomal protein L29
VKAYQLRTATKDDLTKQLNGFKTELVQLRVVQVTGGAPSKLAQM